MSYFTSSASIKADKQESFAYAIYSVFVEFFDKTTLSNPFIFSSLRTNYYATSLDLCAEMETFCEAKAKNVIPSIPKAWRKEVKVSIIRSEKYFTEVRFENDKFMLRVSGKYRRGNSQLIANCEYL